ncbi:type VI secretion system contractile sheath large subunit, partial [Hafnia paralvei]|nr:type VI secretion system contractile sheath large subunit [Hafnia paralvei]
MLMSVQENKAQGNATAVLEHEAPIMQGVYASLFEKINLNPVSSMTDIETFQNN